MQAWQWKHIIISWACLCLALLAGCDWLGSTDETATMVPTASLPASIGTITQRKTIVRQGQKEDQMMAVMGTNPLNEGDYVYVSEGGEGLLTFLNSDLQLSVFNDTKLKTVTVGPAENQSLIARIRLEMGGFTAQFKNPTGKEQFLIDTPNGFKITIHGTIFFVIYNPAEQSLGVGDFEGSVSVAAENSAVSISPQHYVIIKSGQPVEPERPIPISRGDMEEAFRQQGSPVTVLTRVLEPTLTPAPPTDTPIPTGTSTLTLTPTPACPPRLEVQLAANCRAGPGTNWKVITGFPTATLLDTSGSTRFNDLLWWKISIPNTTGSSCWIADSTVRVIGETSCLKELWAPPTYTPAATNTSVPSAPSLISPVNGASVTCSYGVSPDVLLKWSPVTGAVSYEWTLEFPPSTSLSPKTGTTSGTSASVKVACPASAPEGDHTWKVRAVDGAGNTWPYSDTWVIMVDNSFAGGSPTP